MKIKNSLTNLQSAKLQLEGILALHKIVKIRSPLPVSSGKIDEGLLQGILQKMDLRLSGYEKYSTPFQKSACILEGISRLHPFTDGNKRTALLCTISYLQSKQIKINLNSNDILYVQYVASCQYREERQIEQLIDEIAMWLSHKVIS